MPFPTASAPEATTPRWYERAPATVWQRYAVAALATAAAIALTAWLHPYIERTIFIFAFGAVTVTSWYGGRWAGLLVAATMFVFVVYEYYPPRGSFGLHTPAEAVSLVAFIVMSTLLTLVTDSLRRQRARASEAAVRATALAEQLRGQADELARQVEIAQELSTELEETNAQLGETNDRLGESEQRFRSIADSAPVLVWTADLDGEREFVNEPWLEFTGRGIERELGRGWVEGVHPDDRLRVLETYATAERAREPFEIEYRLRSRDGEYRWILDRGVPRRDPGGDVVGFIGSAIDITDRRTAEHERQLLLEREAGLRRAAEAADRAKSEFLAAMSHELRTPLNAIGGYVQLLDLGLRGPLTDDQRRDLERISRNQRHLLALVSDVLDFNRIAAGKVQVAAQPVALQEVVEALGALVSPQIEAKGLRYEVTLPPTPLVVSGDREKLLRILANLVSNAVKFTPERGRVWLSAERNAHRAWVRVRDSGPGIPSDKLELVFEPFVQLERSLTNTIDGAGLGLTISRELARAMGGDVTVKSGDGEGAEFVVELALVG